MVGLGKKDGAAAEEARLFELHGAVIGGRDLRHLLGYKTGDAFRQAAHRQTLPVSTFFLDGRRGRFAATKNVARWKASIEGA